MKANKEKLALCILIQGMSKIELIDAIAVSGKLTKADAGRLMKTLTEDELMKFIFGMNKTKLIDAVSAGAKLTKADAGRVVNVTSALIQAKLKIVFGGKGQ